MTAAVWALAGIVVGVTVLMFSAVWPMRRRVNGLIREKDKHCRQIHQLQVVLDETVSFVYGGTFGVMPAETAQFAAEMAEDEEQEREGA